MVKLNVRSGFIPAPASEPIGPPYLCQSNGTVMQQALQSSFHLDPVSVKLIDEIDSIPVGLSTPPLLLDYLMLRMGTGFSSSSS